MRISPLRHLQEASSASFLPYGPADPTTGGAAELVETFGEYEAEYAAIRRGVGILEMPHRGVIKVRGSDRAAFLHNMLTHDTKGLAPGQGRRAFLLGRTGRIEADLVVLQEAERTWLVLDLFDAAKVQKSLSSYLFAEDVSLAEASDDWVELALHGPQAAELLASVSAEPGGTLGELAPLAHRTVSCADSPCLVFRRDETGAMGLHLLVPRSGAAQVYAALVDAVGGLVPEVTGGSPRAIRGRGIGWLAYNTARIEAGSPLYHIDFGPDSLPHETGVLPEAVSFTKGCYLGQEVVARMQNLGHPKRMLVGLKLPDDRLPIAGSPVTASAVPATAAEGTSGAVIGAVTSSTLSPMLGGTAVAFAMVKWSYHRLGTAVLVPAEGASATAAVHGLSFLPPHAPVT